MIRVLLLVPELPIHLSDIKGGVHSASLNLIQGFSLLNINVRVISFSREVKHTITKEISPNIQIIYIPEGVFEFHTLNYLIIVPFKLKRQIKLFNPDIIHFEVGNTFLLTRILGLSHKKYLLTIHGMSYDEGKIKKKWTDKITWYFNAMTQDLLYPKNIIHLSQFSKNKFSNFREDHSVVIPNAIINDYFNIPLKIKTDNKLLYIGLIDINKNLYFLLKQLSKLLSNDFYYSLEIVGDFISDEYKQIIQNFISKNQLEKYVTFHGWTPQHQLIQILHKVDLLVVSSMHESLPMVIAESMAAGKVVVSSDVGGIPEMINDNKTGFLFSLKQESKFIETMEFLYNNDECCQRISTNARNFAYNSFHSGVIAEKTIKFYNEIINDK